MGCQIRYPCWIIPHLCTFYKWSTLDATTAYGYTFAGSPQSLVTLEQAQDVGMGAHLEPKLSGWKKQRLVGHLEIWVALQSLPNLPRFNDWKSPNLNDLSILFNSQSHMLLSKICPLVHHNRLFCPSVNRGARFKAVSSFMNLGGKVLLASLPWELFGHYSHHCFPSIFFDGHSL